jgi:ABC-type transport system involved in cytochrome bd biosynthesis fused ATPase/permease subunit
MGGAAMDSSTSMQKFETVKRLRDVSRAVELEPLKSGDSRYVEMSKGRSTIDLGMMREALEDFDAQHGQFAKIAFTGHRGCGKSTELLRLENERGLCRVGRRSGGRKPDHARLWIRFADR